MLEIINRSALIRPEPPPSSAENEIIPIRIVDLRERNG